MTKQFWFRHPMKSLELRDTISYFEVQYLSESAYFPPNHYYTIRQLEVRGTTYIASSHRNKRLGLTMMDRPTPTLDMQLPTQAEAISALEFENAWGEAMANTAAQWEATKVSFPPGTSVEGKTYKFYPQGILIDFGQEFLGCIDRRAYQQLAPEKKLLRTGVAIQCMIVNHDDRDQWIGLDPQSLN